jgi:hypothetical protein
MAPPRSHPCPPRGPRAPLPPRPPVACHVRAYAPRCSPSGGQGRPGGTPTALLPGSLAHSNRNEGHSLQKRTGRALGSGRRPRAQQLPSYQELSVASATPAAPALARHVRRARWFRLATSQRQQPSTHPRLSCQPAARRDGSPRSTIARGSEAAPAAGQQHLMSRVRVLIALTVLVGTARFELATFWPPARRANQAAPRPDLFHGHRSDGRQAITIAARQAAFLAASNRCHPRLPLGLSVGCGVAPCAAPHCAGQLRYGMSYTFACRPDSKECSRPSRSDPPHSQPDSVVPAPLPLSVAPKERSRRIRPLRTVIHSRSWRVSAEQGEVYLEWLKLKELS